MYELSLVPCKGNARSVLVQAFVVDDISTINNIHVEEIKKSYAHLSNIYFSDVCRSTDFLEIDILIGSSYLWNFQEESVITGEPKKPLAVKTVPGWVLSGSVAGGLFLF